MRILIAAMISVFISAGASTAATLSFLGHIDHIFHDSGTSDLSGLALGMEVTGSIDDTSFSGSVTSDPGTIAFDCCIAAGGLEISNDVTLDADSAALLNSIQSVRSFAAGDVIDLIDIEGDTDSDAGRIEVGLSMIFDAATVDDTDPSGYPAGDPLFTLFFLLQDSPTDGDIFEAIGLVDRLAGLPHPDPDPDLSAVPLPGGAVLLITALAGLGLGRRRRG